MSKTDKIRAKYNYRREYFNHNKGIFGYFYICSQCLKIVRRPDVEVDHILPLAKGGINHVINCTACCRRCNRSKSDKVDKRVIKGALFKVFEEIFIGLGFVFGGVFKTIFLPITHTSTLLPKIIAIVLYLLALKHFIT